MSAVLVCLRHAESENVVTGASGALPQAPLTPYGHRQAAAAAAAPELAGAERLYASTALRARQTAEGIAGRLGAEVDAVPELVEMGIGDREGEVDAALLRETADVPRAWVVDAELPPAVPFVVRAAGDRWHCVRWPEPTPVG